jgi:hypothetical protein
VTRRRIVVESLRVRVRGVDPAEGRRLGTEVARALAARLAAGRPPSPSGRVTLRGEVGEGSGRGREIAAAVADDVARRLR